MITFTYQPTKFEDTKIVSELPVNPENPYMVFYASSFASLQPEYSPAILGTRNEIYLNGQLLPVDDWNLCTLVDGDEVLITPAVENNSGGWIQAILGVIIIIIGVVLIETPWWGIPLILMGAGMLLGGAIQLMFGGAPPEVPTFVGGGGGSKSPTYSWEGIQLTAITDRPIGVCYGEHYIGGNVITAYVTSDGDKNYLNLLIGLCEGEIEGIMKADGTGVCVENTDTPDITVNGQPLANYSTDVQWDYRLGTNNQTTISGFNNTHTFYNDGRKIVTHVDYTTASTNCNEVEIRLMCPSLFATDGNGNQVNNIVKFSIECRLHGTSTWSYAITPSWITNPEYTQWWTDYQEFLLSLRLSQNQLGWTIKEATDLWLLMYPEPASYLWVEKRILNEVEITDCSKSVVRRSQPILSLAAGIYDIRVTRLSPEQSDFRSASDLYLDGVDEITYNDLSYPNTALLSFKMLATDQLSGSIPNIVTRIRGRKVRVPALTCRGNVVNYNDTYWDVAQNAYISPASYAGDNKCVIDTTYTNWSLQWTQTPVWCLIDYLTNKRYGLGDYITDSLIDWTYALTAAKYADTKVDSLDGLGTLEKRFLCDGVWDTAQTGLDSIMEFCRIFRSWVIWSEGKLKFIIDKAENPVQLFNMSNIVSGSYSQTFAPKTTQTNCVELQYSDKDNEYKLNTVEVVDQDAWSTGETQVKTTMSLKGVTRRSQVTREARFYLNSAKYRTQVISFKGTLNSVHCQAGDTISFQHDVPQWAYGGRVVTASLYANTITLDSDVTVTATPSKLFFQSPLDVFTTATVTGATGTRRVLTISPVLMTTTVPTEGCVWSFGAAGAEKKDFKILGISKDKDNEVVVSALEYNESVYSDTGDVVVLVDPSTLPNPTEPPGPVADLLLTEVENRVAFVVSFNIPQADMRFKYAKILLSTNNETFYEYVRSTTAKDTEIPGVAGTTYYVNVETYNYFNITSQNNVQRASITLRSADYPADVTGLEIAGITVNSTTFTGKDCKIQWKRIETNSSSSSSSITDYRVEVVIDGTLVRTEYATDTWYTYTFEHNSEDTHNNPSPIFTFKVVARNRSNFVSKIPAVLTVYNDIPTPISNLSAKGELQNVSLFWSNPLDVDRQQTCIYRYTADNTASAVIVREVSANDNSCVDASLIKAYAVTYYYWGKVKDVYNQLSPFSNTASAKIFPINASWLDDTPPAVPTGFHLSTRTTADSDGHQNSYLDANWNANTDWDLVGYQFRYKPSSRNYYSYNLTATPIIAVEVLGNTEYTAAVCAYDKLNNYSAFCSLATIISARDTVPPGVPSGLTAEAGIKVVILSWTPNTESDFKEYLLYRNTTSNFGTSYLRNTSRTTIYSDNGSMNTAYYYWLQSKDTSDNLSSTCGPVSATTAYINTVDLAATLIAASNIRTNAIASVHISTNAITSSKIVDNAVASVKIQTNAITETKITASAVTTAKLVTGAVIAAKIAANAVVASTINANAVTAVKINALAITSGKIAANAVVASTINANAVTAAKIAAGSVTTLKLAAGAVVASTIAANAIVSDKIAANAITAVKMAANSVTASAIKAGSVAVGKLTFSNLSGLNAAEGAKLTSVTASADYTLSAVEDGIALSSGGLTFESTSTGYIKGGKTSYADNTAGFYLGYTSAIAYHTFAIGDATNYLRWNGADLIIRGDIRADAGYFKSVTLGLTGVISGTLELQFKPGGGSTYIHKGKTAFTNVADGFILGIDDADDKAKFYIGSSTQYLNWDGTVLVVTGDYKTSATVGTTQGIHLDTTNNELYFYGNSGSGSITQLASIGLKSYGSDYVIGFFGSSTSTRIGLGGESYSNTGVFGISQLQVGVYGRSHDSIGVWGESNHLYGVYGLSTLNYGGCFVGGLADVYLNGLGVIKSSVSHAASSSYAIGLHDGTHIVRWKWTGTKLEGWVDDTKVFTT